jgi:hypothetical protein
MLAMTAIALMDGFCTSAEITDLTGLEIDETGRAMLMAVAFGEVERRDGKYGLSSRPQARLASEVRNTADEARSRLTEP